MTPLSLLAPFTLAQSWRPMLDPMPISEYWPFLLIPLSLGISIAYKAVRVGSREAYLKSIVVMTTQIVLAMIAMGIFAYIFIYYLVPAITPISA
jgi:hypothetical protein